MLCSPGSAAVATPPLAPPCSSSLVLLAADVRMRIMWILRIVWTTCLASQQAGGSSADCFEKHLELVDDVVGRLGKAGITVRDRGFGLRWLRASWAWALGVGLRARIGARGSVSRI